MILFTRSSKPSATALSAALFVFAAIALPSARAADLLPPPPLPAPPAMMAPLDTSGWYLRADIGAGFNQLSSAVSSYGFNSYGAPPPAITNVFNSIGNSATFGAGAGFQFNNWFRGDITGEYRTAANYRRGTAYTAFCPVGVCGDAYTANVSSLVFLANGYVDLGTWYGLTPFAGAGVGFARNTIANLTDTSVGTTGVGTAQDNAKTNFAWALMAGLGYSISPNLKLEVGYRYLNMGNASSNPIACSDYSSCFGEVQSYKASSHDIRIGMRWMLAGDNYAPVSAPALFAPPPGPLVRKY